MKTKFSVFGMTCAACSAGIERTVQKIEGVHFVEVSLMGESMTVDFDENVVESKTICRAVEQLGYAIKPYDENVLQAKEPQPDRLKKRFLLSTFFLIPLMYCSMGGMIGLPTPPDSYSYVIQAVLSLVVLILNFKFFKF